MSKDIHVLVLDGMADWEAALALAELRNAGKRTVVSVGASLDAVTTMGGLRVQPDLKLADLSTSQVGMFILPGGTAYASGSYPKALLEQKLHLLVDAGVPVAAICGATLALAHAGLLNARAHTSNDLGWLQAMVPDYSGAAHYQDALAVCDGGIITAPGTGSTEFAREILTELGVYAAAKRTLWFELYKTGRFPADADVGAYFAA